MSKHPVWFNQWAAAFYKSKEWIALRDEVRDEAKMRCAICHKLIRGKAIADHLIEITPENYTDESITLNKDNLRLLCIDCHNAKTFGSKINFEPTPERKINLF
jgi:5-methylcytosine-specific restriction endonuclease McrA